MASLYELTGQMRTLMDMASDPDVDEQVLADTMESLDFEIEEKADGYAKIIQSLKAQVEGLKGEIERLQSRKRTIENNIDGMKRNLEDSMRAIGKLKFKTDLFSFGIQKNPMTVEIVGEVPKKFLIEQEPKVDKKALIEFVKANGDTDYAKKVQTEGLRIR
ncbi:MAG: siphovirus Gp157 family protein [Bacteroidales bacterium]|nr:siphovirus Gp157 family protein [Bacteroidales bacterium]